MTIGITAVLGGKISAQKGHRHIRTAPMFGF